MQEDCERNGQRKCKGDPAGDKSRSEKSKMQNGVLCGWKKDSFLKDYDRFRRIVEKSRFACRKCGRVAAEESWLCKPVRLAK